MTVVRRADVVDAPMTVRDVEELVSSSAAGAVVTFSGDVRDHDHGRFVAHLEYEGHPTAAAVLAEVAREVAERHDVIAIAVMHRVGPLKIGESALVAAVSAAHRGEAFKACSDLVDETKHRLPVWKHQVFTDGTDEWVNCA
ncbi:MAG TPA: molybdenum cofactor biosynthesis protein MoaE [Candidatus Nanopelagicales bacterium]|nr:molybdenum cofactor biosynthesis protein MoaE [Candidatus Nanopelagicales bacterium]